MKISKLRKFAWVFFALVLTATTVYSQGNRNGKRLNNGQKNSCLEQISNLSEAQKTSIEKLNGQHQSEMAELRQERRSTADIDEKESIREEMLEKVENHRDAVKNLLTDDQQKEYATLHARNRNFTEQGFGNCGQQGFRGKKVSSSKGSGVQQGRGMKGQGKRGMNGRRSQIYNQPGCIYFEGEKSKS